MQKNTLLAIILSIAVLVIYYGFFFEPPKPGQPQPGQPSNASEAPTSAPSAPSEPTAAPQEPSVPKTPAETAPPQAPVVMTELSTALVKAQLSSKSGFPLQWWLQKFYEQADQKGPHIELLKGNELNPPFGILLYAGKSAYYPYYSLKEKTDQSVTYLSQLGQLSLEQHLVLGKQDYAVDVKLKVRNLSQTPQSISPGLRLGVPQKEKEPSGGFFGLGQTSNQIFPLYRMANSVEREKDVDKLGIYQEQVGDISWVGLEDRYFLRAILPERITAQNKTAYGQKGTWVYTDFQYPLDTLAPGDQKEYAFTLYLGPKDPTYLNQFSGAELGQAIDYGFFGIVARPILLSLKLFHSFLGNWGLAIIFLTVVIKILLYPLTRKSMASMKAMQEIQPQLKKIREKYKDDKERLNMETMNLFKSNKVNPMGGCLPMLLQMPIYIALYNVLYNATELYHAPFFWFYRDLSAPDPYYILPVLLGVFMVLQQRMTPTAGDATQAKMMMLMPIMFTVFMLFLPVGLVLYIFVNTVMTVIQQYMHQKNISILGLMRKKAR